MGLDVSVARILSLRRLTKEPKRDEFGDLEGYIEIYPAPHFHRRLGTLKPGFYEGEYISDFGAGSYSSYNDFRNVLSQVFLGHDDQYAWTHRAQFRRKPFYELINFSDCEGWLGPKACKKLCKDFADGEEAFVKAFQSGNIKDFFPWMLDYYQKFKTGFAAADHYENVVVQYH